jgi:hypothetical protein
MPAAEPVAKVKLRTPHGV